MSWEDHNARRNALQTEIANDRAACRDTDLAGASANIEVGWGRGRQPDWLAMNTASNDHCWQ
jgi:hypothetical protein